MNNFCNDYSKNDIEIICSTIVLFLLMCSNVLRFLFVCEKGII